MCIRDRNNADANFNLTTSVDAGIETTNASTNDRLICDALGWCSTAGPISGNQIDKKAPTITINSPIATTYQLNAVVAASYTCTDGGSGMSSGVALCQGSVASGSAIDTSSTGTKTFIVNAKDSVGNAAVTASVVYTVVTGGGGGQTSADLSLALSAPTKVAPGGTLTYSITVTNRSNTTANGVVVSDALPPGTVFANASPSGTFSNGTVTFNLGSIPGNGTANMSFNVTVT